MSSGITSEESSAALRPITREHSEVMDNVSAAALPMAWEEQVEQTAATVPLSGMEDCSDVPSQGTRSRTSVSASVTSSMPETISRTEEQRPSLRPTKRSASELLLQSDEDAASRAATSGLPSAAVESLSVPSILAPCLWPVEGTPVLPNTPSCRVVVVDKDPVYYPTADTSAMPVVLSPRRSGDNRRNSGGGYMDDIAEVPSLSCSARCGESMSFMQNSLIVDSAKKRRTNSTRMRDSSTSNPDSTRSPSCTGLNTSASRRGRASSRKGCRRKPAGTSEAAEEQRKRNANVRFAPGVKGGEAVVEGGGDSMDCVAAVIDELGQQYGNGGEELLGTTTNSDDVFEFGWNSPRNEGRETPLY